MLKRYNGILLFSKPLKENDLFIKFLSNTDEIISGIVYGGLSKQKKHIFQIGSFINFNVKVIYNKPKSISGELTNPFISEILNNKFKLNCLLATISILNLSIVEGQKIKDIYKISENFLKIMISKDRWLIDNFHFLINLLKIIGYDIDLKNNKKHQYFDLHDLKFTKINSSSTVLFPHVFFLNNQENNKKIDLNNVIIFFKVFETVFLKNHLSILNLRLPNHYDLFKNQIISYLKNI